MVARSRTKKRQGPALPASTIMCLELLSKEKLKGLEELVGRRFRNPALLAQAVVHHSCHVEVNGKVIIQSNEKLEHYGDRVVGVSVCRYLHRKYPQHNEGVFHKVLSQALSNGTFAECADAIGLRSFVVTNKNMTSKEDSAWNNILADAFEALAGALDWDGDPTAVDKFLSRVLYPRVDTIVEQVLNPSPAAPRPAAKVKIGGQVHQAMQSKGLGVPRYVTDKDGDGHVTHIFGKNNIVLVSAKGTTPTQSKKSAMSKLLHELSKETNAPPP